MKHIKRISGQRGRFQKKKIVVPEGPTELAMIIIAQDGEKFEIQRRVPLGFWKLPSWKRKSYFKKRFPTSTWAGNGEPGGSTNWL